MHKQTNSDTGDTETRRHGDRKGDRQPQDNTVTITITTGSTHNQNNVSGNHEALILLPKS